jgi:hypothetical protein
LSQFGLDVDELIQFELPAENRDEYRRALPVELVDLGVLSIMDDGDFVVVGSGRTKSFTTTRMVESKDNSASLGPNFSLPVMNVRRLSGNLGRIFDLDFEVFGTISVRKAAGENCQVGGTGTAGNDCSITAATCAGPGVGNGAGWSAACSVKCYDGYKPCCNCYPWNKSASCTCSLDSVAIDGCLIPIKFGFEN